MGELNVHLNGRVVPASQATISVSDAGFVHGASVFSTMLARNGRVFRLDRHLARLTATARRFALRTDATAEQLTAAVDELLAANSLADARVRITLSPGQAEGEGPTTTLLTADPLPEYPPQWYSEGIGVIVTQFKQSRDDPLCGYKTGCYLPRLLARQAAAAKGMTEALWFTTDNLLAEACFCNVFCVLGGQVVTPPLDTPVLPGVVREAVVELCGERGVECTDNRPVTVREMLAAEEMFLTSSCSGVRPVVRVERHAVGDEKPGPITKQIMAAYAELLDRECPA